MLEDQVTHTPSVLESLRNLVGLAENRCTRLWRYKAALDDARAAIAAAEQAVLAVTTHAALTARVAELEAENEGLRRDASILLANIDWMKDATCEGPEGEDAAMIEQIRADIERPSAALTKPEA